MEAAQVGLFFRPMATRHRKKTTIISSNLGFSEWASFLKNDRLTVALIDRLMENRHVLNMKNCISLRPKEPEAAAKTAKARPATPTSPSAAHP